MPYKNVIFDYDGVLVQSLDPWYAAMDKTNTEFNISMDDRQKMYVMPEFDRAGELGIPKDKLESYKTRLRAVAMPAVHAAPFYDWVKEMLSSLTKGGLKLSVLSGNTHLRMYLDEKGISNYFEPYIISGADVKNKKPDPEGIEKLLVMMKASRSETVLVGDSGSDIEASNSAHIDSILFYPKDHARFYDLKELKAQKPTHIVASHQELEKLLLDQRKEK